MCTRDCRSAVDDSIRGLKDQEVDKEMYLDDKMDQLKCWEPLEIKKHPIRDHISSEPTLAISNRPNLIGSSLRRLRSNK